MVEAPKGTRRVSLMMSTKRLKRPGLASKVRLHTWTQSVPPRGSGWVDDQQCNIANDFEFAALTLPLPRCGTDRVQQRFRTFEAKPVSSQQCSTSRGTFSSTAPKTQTYQSPFVL